MSTFTTWRKKNALALTYKRYYRRLLRAIRTVLLPPLQWRQYQQLCQRSTAASLIRNNAELPGYEERPFNKYLNTRWNGGQKLSVAMSSLLFIEQRFNPHGLQQLYNFAQQGILLGAVTLKDGSRLSARLMCSPFPREGDLDISLWVDDCNKLYSLSFSATHDGILWLAGLQGGRGDGELIKTVTRQAYGMRPKNMLMALAWQFARSFELNEINGIANHSQVKSRYLKSSYDEFWLECGGERRQTGWFALPQQEPIKDIQAVKSSKRSEFRRRMALRDELCESAAMTLEAMRSHSAPQTNNICATEPAPQPLASQHM